MEHINNNKQDVYRRCVLSAWHPQSHFSASEPSFSGHGNNSFILEISYRWFRLAMVILVSLSSGQFRVDMWPCSSQWDLRKYIGGRFLGKLFILKGKYQRDGPPPFSGCFPVQIWLLRSAVVILQQSKSCHIKITEKKYSDLTQTLPDKKEK